MIGNGTESTQASTAAWVVPEDFDADNVSVSVIPGPGTYERSKILYTFSPDVTKDLVVTVPRQHDAYVMCRGVKKDLYTQGEMKVETNRYGAQLILKADNEHHVALYKLFESVGAKVQEITGSSVTFPVKDMDGYSIVYTNLIHANDGRMFSSAYTADEKLDILSVGQCVVRPSLLLSLLRKSSTEVKVRVQISQMYVHEEVKSFPLANID